MPTGKAILAVRHAAGGGAGLHAGPLCLLEVLAEYVPQVAIALCHNNTHRRLLGSLSSISISISVNSFIVLKLSR